MMPSGFPVTCSGASSCSCPSCADERSAAAAEDEQSARDATLFPPPMFDDCDCASCRDGLRSPTDAARILAALDAAHDVGAWLVLFSQRSPDALSALHLWAVSRNLDVKVTHHESKDGVGPYEVWRVENGDFNCSLHVEVAS